MSGSNDGGHTPGPWNIASFGGRTEVEGGPDSDAIAVLAIDDDQRTNRANARLIAAAPDLLLACQHLLAAYDDARASGHGAILIEEARAAIAKARGGAA